MALSTIQQIHTLVTEKKQFLITFRKDAGSDAIGSVAALMAFLTAQGKRVDVVVDGFVLPDKLQFLKIARSFQNNFSHLQKFILTIDVKNTGVEELSYDVKDEKLRIYITPKHGALAREHITTAQTDFKYDAIFVVDTPDLESLGATYRNNSDLFYTEPVINIDHHIANEQFGQINIVDSTVATSAELLFDIFKQLGEEHISQEVATALLTAMIDSTRSFTAENVKPQTLRTASTLMALGADRQYIIHNLYRTKTIGSLKLWGEALAQLERHENLNLVATRLSRDIFVQTGASESSLYDIVDELIVYSPEAKLILLTHEHANGDDTIHSILYAAKGYDAKALLKSLNPTGDDMRASVTMREKSVREVEEKVIEEVKYRLDALKK
ncbi:MAG: hypothetical protein CO029_00145 [Candidatus Magasanikbacteria bacterium CG_4_9_14_0_2_um_filter_41_10]|uniref:DDH domain-containing protein n=1 Tax=Candidatus Magasanikbacteria bacterium CG_4_10_14_0_2_um_filter_41_31 TaxID=1974639 RepID=A0A2M7V456_9BACT|nr:MAG: hypothetical protein AUJ37_02400 [Candidatus Magasanikbacteria bacterium CG1_02_41_34]PIZ93302.1 MAG: hypothetical protein COX83_02315 [Candidatus Magasanikbacteria bacterium CG_4_10_14_0_2_um_filter_41_31]PJC53936.1 MAG: hypothetical protein CO029_00145 [Candidatus Magasanikbacteria bacterium CG_4_9_14_0_2_um_filter_41_10]